MNIKNRPIVKGVTVDAQGSKDLDDAFWLSEKNGIVTLDVSIADVSSEVVFGSSIDLFARKRGFTVYHANGNNPMLPRKLSENLLSLFPNVERKTITFSIKLDSNTLNILGVDIFRSILKSNAKLSHKIVDEAIGDVSHEFHKFWSKFYVLSQRLLTNRRNNGALAIYNAKKNILTDEMGNIITFSGGQYFKAYIIVQEIMILTNMVVTEYCTKMNIPILYRNHEFKSDSKTEEQFLTFWKNLDSDDFDINSIDAFRKQFSHTLPRARYGIFNFGHFGLRLNSYAHWTSPIRRYPDLLNHYQLVNWLLKEEYCLSNKALNKLADTHNKLYDDYRDKKSEHFRSKAKLKVVTQNEDEVINMNDKLVHTFIKSLTKGEIELNKMRTDVLIQKIQENVLSVYDIAIILFYIPNNQFENWEYLKKNVLEWIKPSLEMLPQIFHIANDNLETELYKKDIKFKDGIYSTRTTIKIGEKEYKSKTIEHTKKKLSLYNSLYSLLFNTCNMFNIGDDNEENISTSHSENYKGKLYEFCQKNCILSPNFELKSIGKDNEKVFCCTASLVFNNNKYISDEFKGKQKAISEQLAAKNLFDKVKYLFKTNTKKISFSDNPVSSLQEYLAKNKLPLPEYLYKITKDGFKCVCMVNEDEKFISHGQNKKSAKKQAALLACESFLS